MRITSWNINSLRFRLDLVTQLYKEHAPDILCLQETKVHNDNFPLEALQKLYPYIVYEGEKSYNGVAILSHIPFKRSFSIDFTHPAQARHVAVEMENGTIIHNLYVPAGGDIPDADVNIKFEHKLRFLACVTEYFTQLYTKKDKIILVGDLNIAPLEHDVWSHKQLLKEVSHSPIEIIAMQYFLDSLSWIDTGRYFVPSTEKLYSWWSYRNQQWEKSNRGRRLDHIWVTPALEKSLKSYHTLKEARNWHLPSDHVPISIDLAIHKSF